MKLSLAILVVYSAVALAAPIISTANKVAVNFYMSYSTGKLNKAISGGLLDIMDFTPYPYGNAKRSSSGQITCQHGTPECIEGSRDPVKDAQQCVTKAGLSWANVHACATGQLGQLLVNAAADATEALSPAHQWVPWVTVNGAPLDDLNNVISIVCNHYQGPTKPAICNA